MRRGGAAGRWSALILAGILASGAPTAAADERPGGLARRGSLGAQLRPRTAEERAKARPEGEAGVVIERVLPDSTATAADLRRGDLLLTLDGERIADPLRLIEMLGRHQAGDVLTIALVRGGERLTKAATLKPRPREAGAGYRVEFGSVESRGKRLRTIVTRPDDDARHPALFVIQGIGSFSIENPPGGPGVYARFIDDFARRGFVTMRVDKPGQGDSEGGPTRDIDFESELDGYRQALRTLKTSAYVAPGNVLIFGHSMGGIMGPLLAAEIPVKGIAVYGTMAVTWHEYVLENARRQMTLAGTDFATIDRALRQDAAIEQYVMDGLSPTEIAARHPELKGQIDDRYNEGKYYGGTHYVYFRQLAEKNLAEAWGRFDGRVLAAWGKADFLSSGEDHALIARIVNRAHPGRGEYLALDGIDHGFYRSASLEEGFRDHRKPDRANNPAFLEALRDWSEKVRGTGTDPEGTDKGRAPSGPGIR